MKQVRVREVMGDRTIIPEDRPCDSCGSSPAYDVYGDWICHDCWQQVSDVIEAAGKGHGEET